MAKLTDTAKKILDDLLTLEVNVIIKQNMTARKMPDPVQALLDVFTEYDFWLCNFAATTNPLWAKYKAELERSGSALSDSARLMVDGALIEQLEPGPKFDSETTEATVEAFDGLRERAKTASEAYRALLNANRIPGGDDGSGVILKRIFRNCDQIKPILERQPASTSQTDRTRASTDYQALALNSDEIMTIRKIWEVGTEVVVMQTVAQLDGDVVTRVQQARAGAADKPIQDFHRDAVGTALTHWQFLVKTFVQFTTGTAGFFAR